jgi:HK97 family phage major capsid protein
MPSLVEVREELTAKRKSLKDIFDEAGPEIDLARVTLLDGDTHYKNAEIRRRNDELAGLAAEEARLSLLEELRAKNLSEVERLTTPSTSLPFGPPGRPGVPTPRSPGGMKGVTFQDYVFGHPQYKAFRDGHVRDVSIEIPFLDFKDLVTLTTISPQAMRQPDVVEMALEQRTVSDFMLQGTVSVGVVEYFEETTFTSTAAAVAEGAVKPEMTLGYTLRNDPIRKIAETIPATKESLDDVTFLESQLRGRLAYAIRREEERQLILGDGIAPNILGLQNRVGVQTIAKGAAEPNSDAIYRAMQRVRGETGLGFAEPTAIVMHPTNYTNYQLLRTADGLYINGGPQTEGPERMWGLPIRQTTGQAVGTALVGAFRPYSEVLRREGLTITMSTEHGTYAVENKVLFIAETRLGLAVYRPSAFCTVTALAA